LPRRGAPTEGTSAAKAGSYSSHFIAAPKALRHPKAGKSSAVSRFETATVRRHGLIVKETGFEFLAPHAVVDLTPIAPETKPVPPLGGLNT